MTFLILNLKAHKWEHVALNPITAYVELDRQLYSNISAFTSSPESLTTFVQGHEIKVDPKNGQCIAVLRFLLWRTPSTLSLTLMTFRTSSPWVTNLLILTLLLRFLHPKSLLQLDAPIICGWQPSYSPFVWQFFPPSANGRGSMNPSPSLDAPTDGPSCRNLALITSCYRLVFGNGYEVWKSGRWQDLVSLIYL